MEETTIPEITVEENKKRQELIHSLAVTLTKAEVDDPLLLSLCNAAETFWMTRLKKELQPEDCLDPFCCAAAFLAAANYLSGQNSGSFRAGDFSVNMENAQLAAVLRNRSEDLMLPYALPKNFAFRSV